MSISSLCVHVCVCMHEEREKKGGKDGGREREKVHILNTQIFLLERKENQVVEVSWGHITSNSRK